MTDREIGTEATLPGFVNLFHAEFSAHAGGVGNFHLDELEFGVWNDFEEIAGETGAGRGRGLAGNGFPCRRSFAVRTFQHSGDRVAGSTGDSTFGAAADQNTARKEIICRQLFVVMGSFLVRTEFANTRKHLLKKDTRHIVLIFVAEVLREQAEVMGRQQRCPF